MGGAIATAVRTMDDAHATPPPQRLRANVQAAFSNRQIALWNFDPVMMDVIAIRHSVIFLFCLARRYKAGALPSCK